MTRSPTQPVARTNTPANITAAAGPPLFREFQIFISLSVRRWGLRSASNKRAKDVSRPCSPCHYPQVRRAQISAAVWQAGLHPGRGNGAYLRFSQSTGFSAVAEDRCEGALVASKPPSRYAPIPEPEPNSLSTPSKPPSSPLQACYWPTSSQLVGNRSDVDPIHIGAVA